MGLFCCPLNGKKNKRKNDEDNIPYTISQQSPDGIKPVVGHSSSEKIHQHHDKNHGKDKQFTQADFNVGPENASVHAPSSSRSSSSKPTRQKLTIKKTRKQEKPSKRKVFGGSGKRDKKSNEFKSGLQNKHKQDNKSAVISSQTSMINSSMETKTSSARHMKDDRRDQTYRENSRRPGDIANPIRNDENSEVRLKPQNEDHFRNTSLLTEVVVSAAVHGSEASYGSNKLSAPLKPMDATRPDSSKMKGPKSNKEDRYRPYPQNEQEIKEPDHTQFANTPKKLPPTNSHTHNTTYRDNSRGQDDIANPIRDDGDSAVRLKPHHEDKFRSTPLLTPVVVSTAVHSSKASNSTNKLPPPLKPMDATRPDSSKMKGSEYHNEYRYRPYPQNEQKILYLNQMKFADTSNNKTPTNSQISSNISTRSNVREWTSIEIVRNMDETKNKEKRAPKYEEQLHAQQDEKVEFVVVEQSVENKFTADREMQQDNVLIDMGDLQTENNASYLNETQSNNSNFAPMNKESRHENSPSKTPSKVPLYENVNVSKSLIHQDIGVKTIRSVSNNLPTRNVTDFPKNEKKTEALQNHNRKTGTTSAVTAEYEKDSTSLATRKIQSGLVTWGSFDTIDIGTYNGHSKKSLATDLDASAHESAHILQEKSVSDLRGDIDKSDTLKIDPAPTLPVIDKSYTESKTKEQTISSLSNSSLTKTEVKESKRETYNNFTETGVVNIVNVKDDTKIEAIKKLPLYQKQSLMEPLDGKQSYTPVYTAPWNTDAYNSMPSPSPLIINRTSHLPNFSPNSLNNIFDYVSAVGINTKQGIKDVISIPEINKHQQQENQRESSSITTINCVTHPKDNDGAVEEDEFTTEVKHIEDSYGSNIDDSKNSGETQIMSTQSSSVKKCIQKYENLHSGNVKNYESSQQFYSMEQRDSYDNGGKRSIDDFNDNCGKEAKWKSDEKETELVKPKFDVSEGSGFNPGSAFIPKYQGYADKMNETYPYTSPSQQNFPNQEGTISQSVLSEKSDNNTMKPESNITSTNSLSENSTDNLTWLIQNDLFYESLSTSNYQSLTSKKEMDLKHESHAPTPNYECKPAANNDGIESTDGSLKTEEISYIESESINVQEVIEIRQQELDESDKSDIVEFSSIAFENSESESESNISTNPKENVAAKYETDLQVKQTHSTVNNANNTDITLQERENNHETDFSTSTPVSHPRPREENPSKSLNIKPSSDVEYLFGKPVIRESHFKSSNHAQIIANQEIMKSLAALDAASKEIDDYEANMSKYSETIKQLDTFDRIVTKAMLKLDKIESHGKLDLRASRKQLVIRMKAVLKQIEDQKKYLTCN